jgi:hypothetical protein
MYTTDTYGNKVIIPENTGKSTADQGTLFAMIIGRTTHHTSNNERVSHTQDQFSVISDGVTVFRRSHYNECIDYCMRYGLSYVDCT